MASIEYCNQSTVGSVNDIRHPTFYVLINSKNGHAQTPFHWPGGGRPSRVCLLERLLSPLRPPCAFACAVAGVKVAVKPFEQSNDRSDKSLLCKNVCLRAVYFVQFPFVRKPGHTRLWSNKITIVGSVREQIYSRLLLKVPQKLLCCRFVNGFAGKYSAFPCCLFTLCDKA